MRDSPRDGKISFQQRERCRRGRRALACDVSSRWLGFGDAFDPQFGNGDAVWVDVLTDSYHELDAELTNPRTRKLTSLMIRIDDLRAIVEQFDEECGRSGV